jgi:CRISPR/Cas system CMR subunit Cmr4 (Cas7 group RAMP superfamily)
MIQSREKVVKEEGASYFEGFIAQGGVLTLTNKRLIWKPNNLSKSEKFEIMLSEIGNVDYYKTLSIIPNGLSLFMKNGDIENFVVDDRIDWRSSICKCLAAEL